METSSGSRHKSPSKAGAKPVLVKSAVRTLEILELIDRRREPVNVRIVSESLGFPQSSTSALLRSLVKIGYLHYNPHGRCYTPTERVPLLGSWVSTRVVREGPVPRTAGALAARFGCVAALVAQVDNWAECIHLADPAGIGSGVLQVGSRLPLATSAAGNALLSALDDTQVGRLIRRLNAEAPANGVVPVTDLIENLARIRLQGYAATMQGETASIAALLPPLAGQSSLVISLFGNPAALRPAVGALREAVKQAGAGWPDRAATAPSWPVPAPPRPLPGHERARSA